MFGYIWEYIYTQVYTKHPAASLMCWLNSMSMFNLWSKLIIIIMKSIKDFQLNVILVKYKHIIAYSHSWNLK